jgi:YVTN family beta-propeller protein
MPTIPAPSKLCVYKEVRMRSFRTPAGVLVLLFIRLSICQAETGLAYVASDLTNTVSVINLATNAVEKTIPVGDFPWGVAVSHTGSFAYVTNYGSANISVISTSTNSVVATIPVGSGPLGVVFTPSGKYAYVANSLSNSVSVVQTSTRKAIKTVQVGKDPYGITITPNGAFVYVANSSSDTVSVISTQTNKVVDTVGVGRVPLFLGISPNGAMVYVPNYGSNTISVIRTADNKIVDTIDVDGAWGAAVSPDGKWLYATDWNAGRGNLVTVFDASTLVIEARITVGKFPEEVAFSADSLFAYVASGGAGGNNGANTVTVIRTASHKVMKVINVVPSPVGIALD